MGGAAAYLVISWLPSRQDCALNWFHRHQLHPRLLLLQIPPSAHDGPPSAHTCTFASMHVKTDDIFFCLMAQPCARFMATSFSGIASQ